MPAKRLPTVREFVHFKRIMEKLGYRMITAIEFRNVFERLGLIAPRPRQGREAGFVFYANELTVCVWTTWLLREMWPREEDAGWVLIVQNGKAAYFSNPIHRVGNFFGRLYCEAFLAHTRVLHRPICTEHHCFMDIVYGKGFGSRYWRCPHGVFHDGGFGGTTDWDCGLNEVQKAFLVQRRKKRAASRKYRELLGQRVGISRFVRRKWAATRPACPHRTP